MKLLIAYGSKGKLFHLTEFSEALEKLGVECKLVKDTDYSKGFPSKKISDWLPDKKFQKLIQEFKPDAIFIDRQSHFGIDALKIDIPLFVLLRGHYWSEQEWAKKTIYKDLKNRTILGLRNRISEKIFAKCTAIFPICEYLVDIIKEHHPSQKTHVFFEGIDKERWHSVKGAELKHPCVGLLQDANWWGKTKEMLTLKEVLKSTPNVTFYWAGDGPYREKILEELKEFENFVWLGRLDYPDKVREFLAEIDIYALISGMDLAPLTLKEAQLMEKPVIATNVGGIPEMMKDKISGFLVKEGDSDDLIKKLSILLKDDDLKKKMGRNGREFVIEEFSWDVIAKRFIKNIASYIKK
ncbi:glycosyltransferase family 4 protein [Nitrosopumilus sp.]|uniref:glycosyltransferase family 4 protein n=1 Tax=Nitrosopumilus sp. TaxID=2024843 RepID=UPI003D1305CF